MMLYQIKDKNEIVLGVHECLPKDIRQYLAALPRQGSPYRATAVPVVRQPIREMVVDAVQSWSLLKGVVIGFVAAQSIDIGLYFAFHNLLGVK